MWLRSLCGIAVAMLVTVSCLAEKTPLGEARCDFADGKHVVIAYKRPYKGGRKIYGGALPWNKSWRTGDAKVVSDTNLTFGDKTWVPCCKSYLYMTPGQTKWRLDILYNTPQRSESTIIVESTMQWETLLNPVEQFTISFEQKSPTSCELRMDWENTRAFIAVSESQF